MLKFIYFLIFPLLLAYPNRLLEGTYINYIYVCFTFAVFVLFDKRPFKAELFKSFYFILFLIVLFASIISINIDDKFQITDFSYLAVILRYLSFFLLFTLLVCTTNDRDDFIFWMKSFFCGYALSIVLILLDASRFTAIEPIFKMISFEQENTLDIFFRAYGAYLSPISAGIFIMNTSILIFSIIIAKVPLSKKNLVLLYILTALSFFTLISTASRTALVGYAVMLFCIVLFSKNKFKYLLGIGFIALLLLQLDVVQFYIENITIRTQYEGSFGNSALEGSGRIETFIHSLQLFLNERVLLFGVGPTEYNWGDGNNFSYAHNGYLSILLCYGLAGVLLFIFSVKKLIMIYLDFKTGKKSAFLRIYILLFMGANLVSFISSDGPVTYFWLIYLVIFSYVIDYVTNETNEINY